MSKLDQSLRVKHGLAAVAAALTLGIAGSAIAGGAGQSDSVRASGPSEVARLDGSVHYRSERRTVRANSQAFEIVDCPAGTKVIGGGVESSAGFSNGSGMMINSTNPFDDNDGNDSVDDGWEGAVDVFQNAGGGRIKVWAICVG